MSDVRAAPSASSPVGGARPDGDALPGETVRTLFDRNEQVLEELRAELADAEAEADGLEARARAHPALGLLAADEVAVLVPPERDRAAGPAPDADPPRTTAVRRRRAEPVTVAHDDGAPVPGGDDGRSRVGRLVTSHWVWKAGVAVTVVAVLLLKFG